MQPFNNNDAGRLNLKQNNRIIETFDGKWFRKFEVSEDRQIQKVESAKAEEKGVLNFASLR
ncbi:MAG: hypothetical protein FWH18_00860 [Marinilabiliaceae bacterium]|nr:hypothetical protein [Marinilabiliaceae bacterium]